MRKAMANFNMTTESNFELKSLSIFVFITVHAFCGMH